MVAWTWRFSAKPVPGENARRILIGGAALFVGLARVDYDGALAGADDNGERQRIRGRAGHEAGRDGDLQGERHQGQPQGDAAM